MTSITSQPAVPATSRPPRSAAHGFQRIDPLGAGAPLVSGLELVAAVLMLKAGAAP